MASFIEANAVELNVNGFGDFDNENYSSFFFLSIRFCLYCISETCPCFVLVWWKTYGIIWLIEIWYGFVFFFFVIETCQFWFNSNKLNIHHHLIAINLFLFLYFPFDFIKFSAKFKFHMNKSIYLIFNESISTTKKKRGFSNWNWIFFSINNFIQSMNVWMHACNEHHFIFKVSESLNIPFLHGTQKIRDGKKSNASVEKLTNKKVQQKIKWKFF